MYVALDLGQKTVRAVLKRQDGTIYRLISHLKTMYSFSSEREVHTLQSQSPFVYQVQGLCVFDNTIKSVVWRSVDDGLY